MKRVLLIFIAVIILCSASLAWSCDLCSIYTSRQSVDYQKGSLQLGLAEQFTDFRKVQDEGKYVDNVARQFLKSSITQIYAAYDVTDSFAVQINLPYILRAYRQIQNGVPNRDHVTGIGDTTILAKYLPVSYKEEDAIFSVQLYGGLKLPTGDPSKLKEESSPHHDEDEVQEAEHDEHGDSHDHSALLRNGGEDHGSDGGVPSVIHGHDIALGSGSIDFPIGTSVFGQYGRVFFGGDIQYIFRTQGYYDYTYANDLIWMATTGIYPILEHEYALALKFNMMGEYKKNDTMNGVRSHDTAITTLFVGPGIFFTSESSFNAELAWDLPAYLDNSGEQIMPDYRLRGSLGWRF